MCLKKKGSYVKKIKEKYGNNDSINRESKQKNTSHKMNQRTTP